MDKTRDIDRVIVMVKEVLPEVHVEQLQVKHAGVDDDGLWWFSLPGIRKRIQIENSYGNCPFIIETNEQCCDKARESQSIEETVAMIVEYLKMLRKESLNLAL